MMKSNVKSKLAFDSVTAPVEAKIFRLFPEEKPVAAPAPVARESNETIRLRQFAVQSELLRIAQESAPAEITKEDLSVRYQAPRYTQEQEKTVAEQAAMQGAKGFAFKL